MCNNKNKHSGGVSCSACNAFMLVLSRGGSFVFSPAQATTVITADQGIRGGKAIALKKMVDEAVAQCPCVKRVFVYQRTGADVPMGPKDIILDKVILMSQSMANQQDDLYTQQRLRSTWAFTQSHQSWLCIQWVAKDPKLLHAASED